MKKIMLVSMLLLFGVSIQGSHTDVLMGSDTDQSGPGSPVTDSASGCFIGHTPATLRERARNLEGLSFKNASCSTRVKSATAAMERRRSIVFQKSNTI